LANEKLKFENESLKIRLESKQEEIELIKRREIEWLKCVEGALKRTKGESGTAIRKEASKTQFDDEEEVEVTGRGSEEEWVESLKRLSRGFAL